MLVVRRTLALGFVTALLALGPVGTAAANSHPTPSPDPSATASPAASPDPSATASPAASPDPGSSPTSQPAGSPAPSEEPLTGPGCEQDPQICESGGAPDSTECDPFAASPPPTGVVCIASGGVSPETTSDTGGAGAAPGQLPRTGPAPLLPSVAIGSWLVLLGVLAAVAGRRRTASI